jgi:hypothetical protein
MTKIDWEGLSVAIDWEKYSNSRSRSIKVTCRHKTSGNRSMRTYEFPEKITLRPWWHEPAGPGFEINRYTEWDEKIPRSDDNPTWAFKCPKCGYDFRLSHRKLLILICLVDEVEQGKTGRPTARATRLDISSTDMVLA